MQFSGVNSTYLKDGKKQYSINSTSYTKKLNPNSFADLLFGKENFFLENNFYENGKFNDKNIKLFFKKAFKSGKELYLYDVKGYILKNRVKAKKVIYTKDRLILYKCEVIEKKRILRRRKYIINMP